MSSNNNNFFQKNGWKIPNGRFILDYFIKRYIKEDNYFFSLYNDENNLKSYTFKKIPDYLNNNIKIRTRYKNELKASSINNYNFNKEKNEKKLFLVWYYDFDLHPYEIKKHKRIVDESPMSASKKIFYFLQEHDLIPVFETAEATKWYKKMYQRKKILNNIYEEDYKFKDEKSLRNKETTTMSKIDKEYIFNYKKLLKKYNLKKIEDNLVDYYRAIKEWTKELLDKINGFEKEYEKTFNEINKFREKAISLEESKDNNAYKERGMIFKELFAFSFEDLYKTLFELSEKAEELEQQIDKYISNFQFAKLRELEKEKRPSFYLVAKGAGEKVNKHLKKINKINNILPIAQKIFECHEKWSGNYQNFLNNKNKFFKNNVEDSIEEKRAETWFKEWKEKRIEIEFELNQVFESSLRGIIGLDTFELIEENLNNYKQKIDNLFKTERKNIYQKYAFAPAGDMQENFELKDLKFKILNKFMDNIEEILYQSEDNVSRRWLLKWNNSWYNNEIDANLSLIEQEEYQEILNNISFEIRNMRKDNMKEFYNDVQAFVKDRKEREKEYHRLLFKMRKEVSKSNES